MGTAWFRFYAELNDLLPPEKRQKEFAFVFKEDRRAVKDMIEALGIPHTEVDLILVNGVSVGFERPVSDGDRISVYPVFEGVDISSVTLLRPRPLRETALLVHGYEHRLVRHLRALGMDTEHVTKDSADGLLRRCTEENRILVSSSRALLKRKQFQRAVLVPQGPLVKRLSLLVRRLDLFSSISPFTRCLLCNTSLVPAEEEEIEGEVPPMARKGRRLFMSCKTCKKVYWDGSHAAAMKGVIEAVLEKALVFLESEPD